jgi:segregation and condensation protein B
MSLARDLEALLFLAPDPVTAAELADALRVDEDEIAAGLEALGAALAGRGLVLRELAGGWTLASHPDAEEAARRLLSRPRTPALTPAQAETLAIVAYLQPVSRARISAIRGVSVDSVIRTLVARGLVQEAGTDAETGAHLYATTGYFLERMGLTTLDDLPEIAPFLPEMAELEGELALTDAVDEP